MKGERDFQAKYSLLSYSFAKLEETELVGSSHKSFLCFLRCFFWSFSKKEVPNRTRYKTIDPPNKKTLISVSEMSSQDNQIDEIG